MGLMLRTALAVASLLNAKYVSAATAASSQTACKELQSAFPQSVFFPGTADFLTESTDVWSQTCLTTPYCVFQPSDAPQLGSGLQIISHNRARFSVRSGGHMPVPKSNGVDKGVFISMSSLNTTTLSQNNTVAQVGPGQRWADVYEYLSPQGVTVAGGRYSPVGVGGLLVSGGINFFGSQVGWSFNTVVNFEVVLANGTVTNANQATNPDLFWALKGGSNNFGIVTRFDLLTLPVRQIYGGSSVYFDQETCANFFDVVTNYTLPGGGIEDVKAAINPNINLDPATNQWFCTVTSFYNEDNAAPEALQGFASLPANITTVGLRTSFVNFTNETNTMAGYAENSRWLFASTAMKVSPQTVSLLNSTYTASVLDSLRTKLSTTTNSSSSLAIQPISKSWLERARASGGDAIDLDPADGPFIAVLINIQWDSEDDDVMANSIARDFITRLEAASKKADLYFPFYYIGDSQAGQDPFKFYGGGKSLPRMKRIQRAYDPSGFFAKYENSGFKLHRQRKGSF